MGDIIVLLILAVVVVLVVRSMWMNHKKGGHCAGCSGNCGSCSAGCDKQETLHKNQKLKGKKLS